jgi:hypothetical protein
MDLKFEHFRSTESTLPMSYFFEKFELTEDRRKCRKVEELIENYSINLFLYNSAPRLKYIDYGHTDEDRTDLELDFNDLIADIKEIYISKTYLGLMSWLLDRAFCITPTMKSNKMIIKNNTNKNKSLLMKVLYDINSDNLLKCFSKNIKI